MAPKLTLLTTTPRGFSEPANQVRSAAARRTAATFPSSPETTVTLSRMDTFRPPKKKPRPAGRPLPGPSETFHGQEEAEVTTSRRKSPGLAHLIGRRSCGYIETGGVQLRVVTTSVVRKQLCSDGRGTALCQGKPGQLCHFLAGDSGPEPDFGPRCLCLKNGGDHKDSTGESWGKCDRGAASPGEPCMWEVFLMRVEWSQGGAGRTHQSSETSWLASGRS